MQAKTERWMTLVLFVTFVTGAAGAVEWSDRTRDVYVDGHLERTARVLAAVDSDQVAVMAESLPRVVVFDAKALTVGWLDAADFDLSTEVTSASSTGELSPDPSASCQQVDDATYLVEAAGHSLLVAPHQGLAGDLEVAELWHTVPVWRRLARRYEPDSEAVEALRAINRNVEVHLALGTWCGDSKRYVPQVVKALEAADNPRIRLRLTSIRRGFDQPLDFVSEARITNVPTALVFEDGREIGRVIETPAGRSFEADLAAILGGETPQHPGRWQRDRLLARGTYRHEDDGAVAGTETWEMYAYDGDKRLFHSELRVAERRTEVWQRLDAEGRTIFVEITRDGPGGRSRSRHWIEDGQLRSVTRGNTTGIIEQTARLPEDWTVLLPVAVAAAGVGPEVRHQATALAALRLAGAGSPATGLIEPMELRPIGSRELDTASGPVLANGFECHTAGGVTSWFVHPELGVPLLGIESKTRQVVLAELDVVEREVSELDSQGQAGSRPDP